MRFGPVLLPRVFCSSVYFPLFSEASEVYLNCKLGGGGGARDMAKQLRALTAHDAQKFV